MAWPTNPRPAKSLIVLRDHYNSKYPGRNKDSDGLIGDAAHQKVTSDHNPDKNSVVAALDITHDPVHGLNIGIESERLRLSHDPRIKYVIANKRIFEPAKDWTWRPYIGADPHTGHMHISVNVRNYDDPAKWNIDKKEKDMPLTSSQQDKAIKMFKEAEPTAEELSNKDYANNPGLMIETFWNVYGKDRYERAKQLSDTQAKLNELKKSLGELYEKLNQI